MRRKHNVIVEPGEDGRDVEQDSIEEHSKQRQTSQSFVRFAVVIPVAACLGCIALYMAPKNDHRGGPIDVKSELAFRLAESDEAVLHTTLHDVRAFLRSKGNRGEFALTSMGVTRGLYSKQTAHGLSRLNESCHFEPQNSSNSTSLPPPALLLAGALSERPYLRDVSLCFLFYTESLWTRATGGALGPELARLGARLDDKSLLADSLHMYQRNHCPGLEGGGFPPTVVLSDKSTCEMWWRENERWAARDSLWFVKDSHGSLGRHIKLLRGSDVAASALNRSYSCPMPGRVASLEVPRMWTLGSRKFDQRLYVLIPSLDPLIILLRSGYLRVSGAVYMRGRQRGEDAESDRLRHVTNLAVQLHSDAEQQQQQQQPGEAPSAHRKGSGVLQPVTRLREELVRKLGSQEGAAAYRRLEQNAENSILQALFALKHELRVRAGFHRHLWALLAVDVAYDTAQNAYVLDINSGPAPSGVQHPAWYLHDRSATIREAVDILQQVAFRTMVRKLSNTTPAHTLWGGEMETHGYRILFHGGLRGDAMQRRGLLKIGTCVRVYEEEAHPKLNDM